MIQLFFVIHPTTGSLMDQCVELERCPRGLCETDPVRNIIKIPLFSPNFFYLIPLNYYYWRGAWRVSGGSRSEGCGTFRLCCEGEGVGRTSLDESEIK